MPALTVWLTSAIVTQKSVQTVQHRRSKIRLNVSMLSDLCVWRGGIPFSDHILITVLITDYCLSIENLRCNRQ